MGGVSAPGQRAAGAGVSLLVIGGGHVALGAVRYRRILGGMLRDGYVASLLHADPATALRRQRAFWFEVTGIGLVLLGAQTAQLERQGVRPPRQTGWALAGLAVAGGAALPASGFWALLLPAWLIATAAPPPAPAAGRARRAR